MVFVPNLMLLYNRLKYILKSSQTFKWIHLRYKDYSYNIIVFQAIIPVYITPVQLKILVGIEFGGRSGIQQITPLVRILAGLNLAILLWYRIVIRYSRDLTWQSRRQTTKRPNLIPRQIFQLYRMYGTCFLYRLKITHSHTTLRLKMEAGIRYPRDW